MSIATRASIALSQILLEFIDVIEADVTDAEVLRKAAAVLRADPDAYRTAPGLETVVHDIEDPDTQNLVDEVTNLCVTNTSVPYFLLPAELQERLVNALCERQSRFELKALIARLKSRLEWDEIWEEAADGIATRDTKIAQMQAALDRLGSMEAFVLSRIPDWSSPEAKEMMARIEFAREAARTR